LLSNVAMASSMMKKMS